jgi:hypothetical protein
LCHTAALVKPLPKPVALALEKFARKPQRGRDATPGVCAADPGQSRLRLDFRDDGWSGDDGWRDGMPVERWDAGGEAGCRWRSGMTVEKRDDGGEMR